MLKCLKPLLGYVIQATDENIGRVKDFYFDDQHWIIRYLVANTGNWLPGRLVLIATEALGPPKWDDQEFPVMLTAKHVENSPSIEVDQPISVQKEQALRAHFQWPPYWDLGGAPIARKIKPILSAETAQVLDQTEHAGDPHLQNVNEVFDYVIQAVDGKIGHVEDFVIDDLNWHIRYMVIDTGNWIPGKKVLVAPRWIRDISWSDQTASVIHSQEQINSCPEFDPNVPITRQYEEQLYEHYSRTKESL